MTGSEGELLFGVGEVRRWTGVSVDKKVSEVEVLDITTLTQ